MGIPKIKYIKSKLAAAKLLGVVVKNSLTFKIKRGALRRFRKTDFDTIIVDMDGTLYKTDANLAALVIAYPEKVSSGKSAGEEIYSSILSKIASGEYSVERAIIEGNKFLMARKMGKSQFQKVLSYVKPSLRKELIKALLEIKKSGKTIVLATLSSKDFGVELNSFLKKKYRFEFDCIAGTELQFDPSGAISGIKTIVGTKNYSVENIPVTTKLSAIKKELSSTGKNFDIKKALLITDSYADIDLAKMLVTILLKPSNPTTAQKVSHSLGLADYILPDNADLYTNLESIILGAEKEENAEEIEKEN